MVGSKFLIAEADILEMVRISHSSVSGKVQITWLYLSLKPLEVVGSFQRDIGQRCWLLRHYYINAGGVEGQDFVVLGSGRFEWSQNFCRVVSAQVKPKK